MRHAIYGPTIGGEVSDRTAETIGSRVARAWQVLRGVETANGAATRAVMPTTYPNMPGAVGMGSMSLVRTANPQEYKPDGATIRTKGFGAHPVVHACIRVVADIVASVPLVVLTEKGNQESRVGDNHPLQRLLDYPGPRLTARMFRARYAVDYMGYGNSLHQIERRGGVGLPVGLRPINAESLQTVWVDEEGDPRRYDYGNWAGVVVQVPVEDILHFRDLDMPRPFVPDVFGFPRGATAIASMAADNEATNYVRQVVTNDGTPTFAVMLADEATQDDAQAMQDRYRARVVDRGKRGTPAFFGSVKDIKPLGFTLSDLEFPDLRRVSREDICAAYGVDPRMIGIASATSDAGLSGAQYAEARARLVQHTIEPMLSSIEDELNHWLAPEFGNVWITYDHDVLRDLVENDDETSTRVRAEFAASLRTWEESRRALKLSPLPVPTDTLQMTTGTQLVPAAAAVIDPRAVMDEAPATDNEMPAVGPGAMETSAEADTIDAEEAAAGQGQQQGRSMRMMARTFAEDALSGDQIEALMELIESVVEGELPMETAKAIVLAAFPKLKPSAVDLMFAALVGFEPEPEEPEAPEAPEAPKGEDSIATIAAPPAEMGRPWWVEMAEAGTLQDDPRYRMWQRAMDELNQREGKFYTEARDQFAKDAQSVEMLFAEGVRQASRRAFKTNKEILDEINRRIRENYREGGEYYTQWLEGYLDLIGRTYMIGAEQAAGIKLSFSLQSPEVVRAVGNRSARLAELIGEETAKQVTAAIRAAEVAGFSVAETAKLIQASVYGENMTDVRATRIARTESAGAMSQGSWDQAQELGIFQSKEWLAFEDNRTRDTHLFCMAQGPIPMDEMFSNGLQYPLDPAGDAGEVINCRCVLAYYDTAVETNAK